MGLQVIGAGFGRTGTLSLKAALERLLGGPCYHMYEVLSHLEHASAWTAADAGEPVDLAAVMEGYEATVDWPACVFWRELMTVFPDAKVLLSVRPPDRWFASFDETIRQVLLREPPPGIELPEIFQQLTTMADNVVNLRSFGPGFESMGRDEIIAAYERHNAEVRAGVPADRFLEFDVAEGWDPLCTFLGVTVPDEPFPNMNDRAQFRALFGLDDGPGVLDAGADEVEARFRAASDGGAVTPPA
jgi:hypothetical protein